jgi:di/tricarboxylate transporter
MTLLQLYAFMIIFGMMVFFIWGRLRYDLVALLALAASVAVGTVQPDEAFSGFSNDIVIIVASALVVSAAVARSHLIELVLRWLARRLSGFGVQLLVLVGAVTLLSALIKNIGALAMMMPAALKIAKKSRSSPSLFLMPMAFGSLLGGLITMVGTSPNIIVSQVREDLTGQPFRMFDYAPVGLGLSAVGLVFLMLASRFLLPNDRRATATLGEAVNIGDYNSEASVPEGASIIGRTIGDFLGLADGEVTLTGVVREGKRRPVTLPEHAIQMGDILQFRGTPDALELAVKNAGLTLARQDKQTPGTERIGIVEAVVKSNSPILGKSASTSRPSTWSRYPDRADGSLKGSEKQGWSQEMCCCCRDRLKYFRSALRHSGFCRWQNGNCALGPSGAMCSPSPSWPWRWA